jgi:glutathione peroxidase
MKINIFTFKICLFFVVGSVVANGVHAIEVDKKSIAKINFKSTSIDNLNKEVKSCPAILNHKLNKLQDDSVQDLCQYAGKAILVVNTASYCGFTGQYEGLESLYAKYKDRGFIILGFPSNDFGKQEPGTSKQIGDFCFNTYGIQFPMFSKSVVSGVNKNAFYAILEKETGVQPLWNFYKYLIDKNGKVINWYFPFTGPDNSRLVSHIEQALK